MFLIAGIQPRTKTLDPKARLCPTCGLAQAHMRRIDHYFSVFFIPLFRVKTGQPYLFCERCRRREAPEETVSGPGPMREKERRCPYCRKVIDPGFKYCPYCGQAV
jgi:hypothetical protein